MSTINIQIRSPFHGFHRLCSREMVVNLTTAATGTMLQSGQEEPNQPFAFYLWKFVPPERINRAACLWFYCCKSLSLCISSQVGVG